MGLSADLLSDYRINMENVQEATLHFIGARARFHFYACTRN